MQTRMSFSAVAACCVALSLTAGCATHEAVKKDEGMTPAVAAKPVEQPKAAAAPVQQEPKTAAAQPAPVQEAPKAASAPSLQSALDKIYFDFDAATLSDAARSTLAKNADLLAKNAAATVRIEGNCDDRGSAEYNMALGERRAAAAKQYLVTLGVKADRLSTVSYGKEKPAVKGDDEAAWAKNRRDEFVVVTK